MRARQNSQRPLRRLLAGAAAVGAAAAWYMACEARWVECRQRDLVVPGLPPEWSGLTVLHLADVHAGSFSANEQNLERVVRWAVPLAPDLVILTGDVLGRRESSRPCLRLLAQLRPKLGVFAVTGNHEYGVSKAPLARPRSTTDLWQEAGATLLTDNCASLPGRAGRRIVLCGADYLSGGYGLFNPGVASEMAEPRDFPILLVHEPPPSDSPLARIFPLVFAGHTHGGQLRLPGPSGLTALHREDYEHLAGVHAWGRGAIVITRGVGVSFLPFRLFTRPEATLWRLLYTSPATAEVADH